MKITKEEIRDFIYEYKRLIIIGSVIAVAFLGILAFLVGLIVQNSPMGANEVVTKYAVSEAEAGISIGGYDYTLREYKKTTSMEYVAKRYAKKYVDEKSPKGENDDNEEYNKNFNSLMFEYFKFYLSLYSNSTDDFMAMYFNQMQLQKKAEFKSNYISEEFMINVFQDNFNTYRSLNLEALENYGEGEITVNIGKKIKLSKEEKDDYIKSLSEDFTKLLADQELSSKNIKKVAKYRVKTYKGKTETNDEDLYLVKIHGHWYVVDN